MIKRFSFKLFVLLVLLLVPTTVLSGYSNWTSGGTGGVNDVSSQIATPQEQLPVAYYDSNYFPTVEGAVNSANSVGSAKTVYVIPGRNPVIKRSFTINSNITLCLPYDGTTYFTESANLNGTYGDAYKNASANRKSLVTVGDSTNSNITITNNGTINIGGIVSGGGGGQNYNSNTAGSYAELNFYGSASLISNGTINNYGYITGTNSTGSVNFANGSSTVLVYSIREHRGGSIFSGMYSNLKSSAFNRWYFAGIRDITYSFSYGSKITAYCDLYASSSHNSTTVNILYYNSSSYLISLSSGSKLVGKMSTSTSINEMNFYGSFSLNPLNLSVVGQSISTESVEFPLSWYQKITLNAFENGNAATFTSSKQKVKLMPSSYLKVGSNVTATLPALAIYDNFTDVAVGSTPYQNDGHRDTATCIVDGTLNPTSIGGFVQTSQTGGSVSFTNGNYQTYEVNGSSGSSFLTTVTYQSLSWTAHGYLTNETNDATLLSGGAPYISAGTYWNASNNVTAATISPASGASGENAAATFTLTGALSSTAGITATSYTWSVSGTGGSLSATSGETTTLSLTANSGSSDVTVTVTLRVVGSNGTTYTATGQYIRTKKASSSSCFTPNTRILTKGNVYKKFSELTNKDVVLSFNHFTGQIEEKPFVCFGTHGKMYSYYMRLSFSNGSRIEVTSHSFLNANTRIYDDIDIYNCANFIGEEYVTYEDGVLSKTKLINIELLYGEVEPCGFLTENNINCIAEGLINLPPFKGTYGLFEMDENYTYIQEDILESVNKYGYSKYEDWSYLVSERLFETLNMKYLNIAIAKGHVTKEYFEWLIAVMYEVCGNEINYGYSV